MDMLLHNTEVASLVNRLQPVVDELERHKLLIVSALALSPVAYYGVKIYLWKRRVQPVWDALEQNFPGPKRHWLMGNLDQHPGPNEKGIAYNTMLGNKHIYSYVFWFGPFQPNLTLVHPDSIKAVMKTAEPKPIGPGGPYGVLMPWIGDGLLISGGAKWKRNRRLLTPAFHFDVLKPYMTVYNEAIDTFLDKLSRLSSESSYLEIYTPVNLLTLNVILKCAFSYNEDVQNTGEQHPYIYSVIRMSALAIQRLFNPIMWFDIPYKYTLQGLEFFRHTKFAHDVSENVIQKRKQALKENASSVAGRKYKDFLDILLLASDDDGQGLTDREIRDEVDTFLFEGHDTTASAISWILYSLAGHPEHQSKVQEEVDDLLDGRDTDHLTWEDMNNIPYTNKCIKEAMRLHTPVPFIARETTNAVELNGATLPPGTRIDLMLYCVHHNEHVWGKDHNEYKPERFEHENIKNMDSHAYVPFSAGPRNCIGQQFAMHEIKTAVCRTLHRFSLEVDPSRPAVYFPDVVMRTKDGMYVKATPRM